MLELIKAVCNLIALRDSINKGEMTPGAWAAAGSFLLIVCVIALPTIFYYDRHPTASPRIMIAAGVLLGAILVVYFWLAVRWRMRLSRAR